MHDYELYGFSLFETFLARRGTFWRLDEHWNRLAASASYFGIQAPTQERFFKDVCARHDAGREEVVRYALLQGGGRWTDGPARTEIRILKRAYQGEAARSLRLSLDERTLPKQDQMRSHKCGSRMLYQARFNEAKARGYDDCVFMDNEGYLLESSTFNLFFYLDGAWVTPPLSRGLLPGIVRAWLLSNKQVKEKDIRQEDLALCNGVVVSNSVFGLKPVSALGSRMFDANHGEAFIEAVGKREFQPL